MVNFVKFEKISLKNHPELDEKWVQDRIADDPGMLGLGDIYLKDKERIQPRAGRLDLLFQETDGDRRYEVELQLGKTDESHIIRTIEYWDIERRRYPQYDHCAVIIAEDITSRFLNVISLFNGHIPIIALQMSAIQFEGNMGLTFTTVLDEQTLGRVDEDEEVSEPTDRKYWKAKGSEESLKLTDRILELVQKIAPGHELNYNRAYIGLSKGHKANNFLIFKPKKNFVRLEISIDRSEEINALIEESDLELIGYDRRHNRYRTRVTLEEFENVSDMLSILVQRAFETRGS